ncbi:MAG: MBL fold metallo-hydrolase [Robiginitalea sp.]|uniref:MBL fold metallo-hydrolase n=1 Tax=Robiginitalea sp. TaxID=1902411 RepID=UPI003C77B195
MKLLPVFHTTTSLLLLFFFLQQQSLFSQPKSTAVPEGAGLQDRESLKIYPVAHATAVLDWDETIIYIDPVGGPEAFKAYPAPDLILITDIHGDHFSLETLQGLDTQKAKLIVPNAVAEEIPDAFTPQLDVLDNGASKERYGITVTAIPMYNLRPEAKNFHTPGRGNGYVLEKNGMRVYFSGDTEDIPEMRALEDIDKAFICMNLPYTMNVESAADAVIEFAPAEVYPYHYRGKPDVSDVGRFETLVTRANPDIRVVRLDWYPSESY